MLKLLLLNLILFILPDICFTRSVKNGIVRIPLANWNNMIFHASISLGTDDNTCLQVLLDTGSNEVWVPSSDCDRGRTWCTQHGRYNHIDSHSYVNPHRTFSSAVSISVDNAVISGRVSMDQMDIGNVILQKMEFGEAITSSSDLSYSTYDGVLGLGPKNISTVGTPFLQRLLQSGIDDAVFSFVLSHSGDSGTLLVGGVDYDNYIGPIVWSRIISEDKWQIKSDSISIGGKPLCSTNCHIEFNTELEIIIGPKSQIAEVYNILNAEEVPGITIRTVDCSKVDHFPDLSFTVNGEKLSIAPKDYVLKTAVVDTMEFCYLMITSIEDDVDSWVLGTLAHVPLYVVYDFGRSQIGLAKAV